MRGRGGSEYLAEAGRFPQPGMWCHGRTGHDEPGACAGSSASALYHYRPAGVVSHGLGFDGLRILGQEAKAITVAFPVAVAFLPGDVH
jgi:hypothetical protein